MRRDVGVVAKGHVRKESSRGSYAISRMAIRLPPVCKELRLLLIALLACGLVASAAEPVRAGPFDPDCYEGNHSVQGQAIYRICMPLFWNGDLVVYADVYVSLYVLIAIQED